MGLPRVLDEVPVCKGSLPPFEAGSESQTSHPIMLRWRRFCRYYLNCSLQGNGRLLIEVHPQLPCTSPLRYKPTILESPLSSSSSQRKERSSDDLFEKTRMSFGEHLDELRKTLIRALIGVAIGSAFGFSLATPVVKILTGPLERAIIKFNQERAADQILADQGWVGPETQAMLNRRERTPRAVLVDPGQLVTALRNVSPSFLEGLDLQPWRFSIDSIPETEAETIVRMLVEPGTVQNDPAGRISLVTSRLSGSSPDLIAKLKTAGKAAEARGVIAEALNSLLDDRSLSGDPAFAEVVTVPEQGWMTSMFSTPKTTPLQQMKSALDKAFQPDLNRRLNRALITVAFQGKILPQQLDLVPMEIWERTDARPQSLNPIEGFMIWLKAGLITGLVISGPWVFYQVWSFVAAGLYPHEKKQVHVFLPISLLLFVLGVLLVFLFVFDTVLGFFLGVNFSLGIDMQPRINEWLSFVLFLPLGFGLAFQLPLVMLFLNRINVFSVSSYMSKWRIAIMVIFVLAMILTPADPLSMIMLAVPLTFLYFFGVLLCQWFPGRKDPFASHYTE